eukprot:TRINITY_DN10695_c0_g1_i1.p1 TRINITY_DN10695_c0_g1~~TRINITY_DN10695_c0_g1_i1.p1  ORF type:complete len:614 (-),score=131.56 TRINITY_DN10695_c0_g1_i1:2-1843(-)
MRITTIHTLSHIPQSTSFVHIREGDKYITDSHIQFSTVEEDVSPIVSNPVVSEGDDINLTCHTCGITFGSDYHTRDEHFKSDWHVFNIKLKTKGIPSITLQDYQENYADFNGDFDDLLEESDDIEPVILKGSSKIDFYGDNGKVYTLWKNVVSPIANTKIVMSEEYVESLRSLPQRNKWIILMSLGGRFAGGVFEGERCVSHKTFHRYTVRKKQGGSQVSRDNRSATSAPKSIGASIRRFQTKMFIEKIHETLDAWSGHIENCDLIFIYAPSHNWAYFFDLEEPILDKDDDRIRSIPFSSRKPSFEEVKNCFKKLRQIEISDYSKEDIIYQEETVKQLIKPVNNIQEIVGTEVQTLDEEDRITYLIETGDFDKFVEIFSADEYFPDVPFIFSSLLYKRNNILQFLLEGNHVADINYQSFEQLENALHLAFKNNIPKNLIFMLLEKGADPTVKNIHNFYPHQLTKNAGLKKSLRIFAGENLGMWDWKSIGIHPLTPEDVKEFKKKKQEKNRKKRQRKQQKKAETAPESDVIEDKTTIDNEVDNVNHDRNNKIRLMSDREKRALAAEQRILKQAGQNRLCDNCNQEIMGVPFERLNYKYCSTSCVRSHMQILKNQ